MASVANQPWFPKEHPKTGEPFLSYNVEIVMDSNTEMVTYYVGPPDRPSASYTDEDDYVVVRTAEEFAAAISKFEAAYARWVADGSQVGPRHVIENRGPATMSATFRTASGATAKGIRVMPDGEWIWQRLDWSEGAAKRA